MTNLAPNLSFPVYLTASSVLLLAAYIIFRIFVRRDYHRKGKLTLLSTCLEFLIAFLYFSFPCLYLRPDWWMLRLEEVPPVNRVIGSIGLIIGLVIMLTAMAGLGFRRACGQEVNILKTSGSYRFSRNPQITGFALGVIGIFTYWPSWYAVGWALFYIPIFHMMVLTEEEHLSAVYGEQYERYCQRVPRYISFQQRRP